MLTRAEAEREARLDTCPVYLDEEATMQEMLLDHHLKIIHDYGGHLMLVEDSYGKQIILSGDSRGRNVRAHMLLPGQEKASRSKQ